MDGDTYVILMKKVVDEIVEKWPRGDWKTPEYTVYVQDDCAPGHRKKRVWKRNSKNTSLPLFVET